MNNYISFSMAKTALDHATINYLELNLSDDAKIIIVERGGRIIGPFFEGIDESVFWLSNVFNDLVAFKNFVTDSSQWNLGGERVWLSPEQGLNIKDSNNFFESYDLPVEIDPGEYRLSAIEEGAHLSCVMHFNPRGLKLDEVLFQLNRTIIKSSNPLACLKHYLELMQTVKFAGYTHQLTLSQPNSDTSIDAESWTLIQVNPNGKMLIPTCNNASFTPYFGDATEHIKQVKGGFIVDISAAQQFKVGFKAPYLNGRSGYYYKMNNAKQYCLVIRHFNIDASNLYIEEPVNQPGNNGHVLHVYNDDQSFGGFGELEINGRTIGPSTGLHSITDIMQLWCFTGEINKLSAIATILLGMSISPY